MLLIPTTPPRPPWRRHQLRLHLLLLQKKLTMTPEELSRDIATTVNTEESFPAELPIKETIGKCQLMHPNTYATNHAAAPLLRGYATQGCPVDCGPNWDRHHILQMLKRGPHISAKSKAAVCALHAKTADKVKQGYA